MDEHIETLRKLLGSAGGRGPRKQLSPEELETAIRMARAIDDINRRHGYFLVIAEHLALTGGLSDLALAIELAKESSHRWERHSALLEIVERLRKAGEKARVLELIALMESDAAAVEDDQGSGHPASRKALLWAQVADSYGWEGLQEQAQQARERAVKLAADGQYDKDLQDAYDCQKVLRFLVERLMQTSQFEAALQVVEVSNWDDKELWKDALKKLIAAQPGVFYSGPGSGAE